MSYLISEVQHFKEHWFSCLLSCFVVHALMELAEHVIHLVK